MTPAAMQVMVIGLTVWSLFATMWIVILSCNESTNSQNRFDDVVALEKHTAAMRGDIAELGSELRQLRNTLAIAAAGTDPQDKQS